MVLTTRKRAWPWGRAVSGVVLAAMWMASPFGAETAGGSNAAGDPGPPHIVIILADDLGWNDVGYHGSEIRTPHIDGLASRGVELDRFYVQPTCSPTRAGLMTGKSPMKLGITFALGKNDESGLPLGETLLPEYLARAGYQPLMVGKWHLGNFLPDYFPHQRGFEHFYGYLSGGVGYWDHNHGGGHDWQRNGETLREDGYATQLLTDEAVRLLRERDSARPTFLYLALGAPHLPNEAPSESVTKYDDIESEVRRLHAGMVDQLDTAVGRVLATLEEQGMLENTIILFSSDNGGLTRDSMVSEFEGLVDFTLRVFDRPVPIPFLEFLASNLVDAGSDNHPLPRGKATLDEGGVRVPAAIWWPGRLDRGKHEAFMTICDVLPTLLEAIGRSDLVPRGLDGSSQWPALTGTGVARTPDYMIAERAGHALYRPPWKLYAGDTPRLYDVFADPLERNDRAQEYPGRVSELVAAAAAWPKPEREGRSTLLDVIWDPDTFGGPEDREPWADVAKRRARESVRSR